MGRDFKISIISANLVVVGETEHWSDGDLDGSSDGRMNLGWVIVAAPEFLAWVVHFPSKYTTEHFYFIFLSNCFFISLLA